MSLFVTVLSKLYGNLTSILYQNAFTKSVFFKHGFDPPPPFGQCSIDYIIYKSGHPKSIYGFEEETHNCPMIVDTKTTEPVQLQCLDKNLTSES